MEHEAVKLECERLPVGASGYSGGVTGTTVGRERAEHSSAAAAAAARTRARAGRAGGGGREGRVARETRGLEEADVEEARAVEPVVHTLLDHEDAVVHQLPLQEAVHLCAQLCSNCATYQL